MVSDLKFHLSPWWKSNPMLQNCIFIVVHSQGEKKRNRKEGRREMQRKKGRNIKEKMKGGELCVSASQFHQPPILPLRPPSPPRDPPPSFFSDGHGVSCEAGWEKFQVS